jgi:hypothetical protein
MDSLVGFLLKRDSQLRDGLIFSEKASSLPVSRKGTEQMTLIGGHHNLMVSVHQDELDDQLLPDELVKNEILSLEKSGFQLSDHDRNLRPPFRQSNKSSLPLLPIHSTSTGEPLTLMTNNEETFPDIKGAAHVRMRVTGEYHCVKCEKDIDPTWVATTDPIKGAVTVPICENCFCVDFDWASGELLELKEATDVELVEKPAESTPATGN